MKNKNPFITSEWADSELRGLFCLEERKTSCCPATSLQEEKWKEMFT